MSYDGDSFQGRVGLFSLEGPRENCINAGREGREGALGISCPTGPACHHAASSRWDESSENQSSSAPLLRKAKPIENRVIKSRLLEVTQITGGTSRGGWYTLHEALLPIITREDQIWLQSDHPTAFLSPSFLSTF